MLQAKTARCAAIGAPRKKVPESERRRSSRLAIAPERLTYDWSDDEGPKRRSQSSRRNVGPSSATRTRSSAGPPKKRVPGPSLAVQEGLRELTDALDG